MLRTRVRAATAALISYVRGSGGEAAASRPSAALMRREKGRLGQADRRAPAGAAEHRRHERRHAPRARRATPPRRPYVKATLEKAGYNARYEMFNMPEWHETAPPVLQQVSPTSKTYTPGTAADDDSPAVDFIAFEHSPTKRRRRTPVVPTNDIVIPSPAGHDERLRDAGLPGRDERRGVADPARHVRVHAEARRTP